MNMKTSEIPTLIVTLAALGLCGALIVLKVIDVNLGISALATPVIAFWFLKGAFLTPTGNQTQQQQQLISQQQADVIKSILESVPQQLQPVQPVIVHVPTQPTVSVTNERVATENVTSPQSPPEGQQAVYNQPTGNLAGQPQVMMSGTPQPQQVPFPGQERHFGDSMPMAAISQAQQRQQ